MTQLKTMASSGSFVLILFLWLSTRPAFGVDCGETIFVDTDLDRNLIDCPADGIIIGADNIELRLNGFIIDGMDSGSGVRVENGVGVRITGPGVVREFFEGISIDDGNDNEVKGVVVADNDLRGISTLNSSYNKIKGNTAYGNGFTGIQISGGTGNIVRKNDAHGNGAGIYLSGDGNIVSKNNSHGNSNRGISIDQGDNNLVVSNKLSQQNAGAYINGGDGNVFWRNHITDNGGAGVVIQDIGNDVANNNGIIGNVITNAFSGGVRIISGTGTVIKWNTFSKNADQIFDGGIDTVVRWNNCDPADADPVCN